MYDWQAVYEINIKIFYTFFGAVERDMTNPHMYEVLGHFDDQNHLSLLGHLTWFDQ